MRVLFATFMSEHERLRDLLRGLLLLAARAQQGDDQAWRQLVRIDLARELELHAARERAQHDRVVGSPELGRKLAALHQIEARAAIRARAARSLEDALVELAAIVEALAEEERDLMAAQEVREGTAAARQP